MTYPIINPGATAHTPISGAGPTDIATDDMYRMSRLFVEPCSAVPMSLNGHRLLHALLHRTCRDLPEWSAEVRQPPDGYRAPCAALRRTLGLESDNGNRNLAPGIADLRQTNILDVLEFGHQNAWLTWRFEDAMLRTILDGERYGLLDASALRKFGSVADFQIFSLVSVVRRTRKAAFTFEVQQAGIWTGKPEARWSDVSAVIINAIRLSCAHYGLTAVVLLEARGFLAGIDTVVVRLQRRGGLWTASGIAKCSVWTRACVVIDPAGHTRVASADLPDLVARLSKTGWRLKPPQP
ncbi:hypothetical protein ACOI1H_23665 [Loktanella sp. DJP18]|uniref:hypothetical protein n=1 Tax=Loktanella sp. DJP18 TaxID=3409788 RepID=UPI003BB6400F